MISFLKDHQLITLPDYLGRFEIRQLPEAFKPTSPANVGPLRHTVNARRLRVLFAGRVKNSSKISFLANCRYG